MKRFGAWLILGILYFIPMVSVYQTKQTTRLFSEKDFSIYPWVYLRQGFPIRIEEKPGEIVIVGDILCGREGNSLNLSLEDVSGWLQEADLVIGNLECVISSRWVGEREGNQTFENNPYLLHGAPLVAGFLRQAGFDLLGLANNHAFDLGGKGLADTIQFLRQNGIGVIGVRHKGNCEVLPVIVHAGNYRIAFLAFNAVPLNIEEIGSLLPLDFTVESWQERDCFISLLHTAHHEADAVIVMAHWGVEYEERFSLTQKMIAEKLVKSGADLVIGQHPHVPQQVEIFSQPDRQGESVVAYSLGNFLADQEFGETVHGLGLRVMIDHLGLRAVQALPIQAGLRPKLVQVDQDISWLTQVIPKPKQLTFSCDNNSCVKDETFSILPSVDSGLFWSGEIDLTGDGVPEQIQRQAGRVIVYQEGKEAWRSPENWQVVDLALGDPDQDGRQEMMMAFWRQDETGVLRSHPFIVGYRGGAYQETWGGSGVSDPIQELELGDVDGDGFQELMVLEKRISGKQAVSVWDWHGWGFSLKWRSPEGNYNNLKRWRDGANKKDSIIVFNPSS